MSHDELVRAIYRTAAVLAVLLAVVIERLDALVGARLNEYDAGAASLFAVAVAVLALGYLVRSLGAECYEWYVVPDEEPGR